MIFFDCSSPCTYCSIRSLCFFFSSRRRHTRCALVTGVQTCALPIFCRPHIPTGTVLDAAAVRTFLAAIPHRVPVLLDEAYVEFLDQIGRASCRERVCQYV